MKFLLCFSTPFIKVDGLDGSLLATWLTISSSDDSKRDLSTSFPMRQYYALPSWDKIKPSVLPHPPGIACLLFSNAQCTHTSSMSTHPPHNDQLILVIMIISCPRKPQGEDKGTRDIEALEPGAIISDKLFYPPNRGQVETSLFCKLYLFTSWQLIENPVKG